MKTFETFLQRMKKLIPQDEWEAFRNGITKPLDRSIRVNKAFKAPDGWSLKPVKGIAEAFLIDREDRDRKPLGKTLPHFDGQFYSQTLSSMLPVLALDPQPEEKILDVCAAPGSKTTFIANRMHNTGVLIANEMSGSRIKKLVANLNRMGVYNSAVTQVDGQKLTLWYSQEFDKILLDAPCTSEGHGRKDAKFFEKTWHEKAITKSAKLQRRLIEEAFLVLKTGGEMVYSTCTMAPEENELVVQYLVEKYGDYLEILPHGLPKNIPLRSGLDTTLLDDYLPDCLDPRITKYSARIWPHLENETFSSEAFYLCKIRKTRALSRPNPVRKGELQTDFRILKKNEMAEIITKLFKTFGLDKNVFDDFKLIEKNKNIFIANKDTINFARKNKVQRIGFKLMDEYGFLSSEWAIKFGHKMNKNIVQLGDLNFDKWIKGEDIKISQLKDLRTEELGKEVIIQHKCYTVGTGKIITDRNILKNRLDRNLLWR